MRNGRCVEWRRGVLSDLWRVHHSIPFHSTEAVSCQALLAGICPIVAAQLMGISLQCSFLSCLPDSSGCDLTAWDPGEWIQGVLLSPVSWLLAVIKLLAKRAGG